MKAHVLVNAKGYPNVDDIINIVDIERDEQVIAFHLKGGNVRVYNIEYVISYTLVVEEGDVK